MNLCVRMVLLASMLVSVAPGGDSDANPNATPNAGLNGEVAQRGHLKAHANVIGHAVWPTSNTSTSSALWDGAGAWSTRGQSLGNANIGAGGKQHGHETYSRRASSKKGKSTKKASGLPSTSAAGSSGQLYGACGADAKTRWLYVRGFHHSGTTLLTDILALHPSVGSIKNGGHYEDEGQHLQKIFPIVGARTPKKCKGTERFCGCQRTAAIYHNLPPR